jgi:hypothetical protein
MTVHVDQRAKFKIGITVDSFVQPCWVRRCLEKTLATGIADLEVIVEAPPNDSQSSLLYKLYKRMDRALFATDPDALEPVGIEDLVGSARRVRADEWEEIKAADLDVLINLAPAELSTKLAGTAKYGVWFYTFGTSQNEEPGFRELMTEDPVMVSSLRAVTLSPSKEERVIYESVSPTLSRFSIGLNNNQCYWKSAAFLSRALLDLHKNRDGALTQPDKLAVPAEKCLVPTNLVAGQAFLKLAGRAASRAMEKYSSFEQWVLAYRFKDSDFRYLIPPAQTFWADPFPVEAGGRHYIFFEDYLYRDGKGHISVVEVDRDGILNGPTEALRMECHLSYPFVFDWEGEHYMIPESGAKNVVQLYRSASFPSAWQLDEVLLEANHPVDATLIEVEGTWWMFVNIEEEGVTVNWDELHLYYADNPRGPWKPHARNPVVSDVRSARPAGRLFWSHNSLYRPGQDSSLRYGYATTVNRIDRMTPTEYKETEVARILPNWDKHIVGVHTWNTCNEVVAIDCLVKRKRSRKERGLASPIFPANVAELF